ncbi:hypothetical protein ABZ832_06855 [Streptantibioticus parmotrematis]
MTLSPTLTVPIGYANAEIADVQVYGSALPASEVEALDYDQTPYTQLS